MEGKVKYDSIKSCKGYGKTLTCQWCEYKLVSLRQLVASLKTHTQGPSSFTLHSYPGEILNRERGNDLTAAYHESEGLEGA